MAILIFILILVALIIVHELGHFAAAKLFGIRVDEFGVFFPPRIAAWRPRLPDGRQGETEYSLNWLPFGGFVRIFGENAEDGAAGDSRSFVNASRWKQAVVLAAGVAMNAAAAWLLLSAGYMVGLPTAAQHDGIGTVTNARPMIVGILPNSPAQKAGFEPGDIIERIDTGSASMNFLTLNIDKQADVARGFIGAHAEESMVFTVLREGHERSFLAKAAEGLVDGRKAVGLELDDVGVLRLSVPLALVQGAVTAKNMLVSTARGMAGFITQALQGRANLNEVSGPIGIVTMGGVAVKEGFAASIVLVSAISLSLTVLNLLPIPGLDGGRLLIVAIEGITRRRVPQTAVTYLTLGGMALLIVLMLVVSFHDVAKLVG